MRIVDLLTRRLSGEQAGLFREPWEGYYSHASRIASKRERGHNGRVEAEALWVAVVWHGRELFPAEYLKPQFRHSVTGRAPISTKCRAEQIESSTEIF